MDEPLNTRNNVFRQTSKTHSEVMSPRTESNYQSAAPLRDRSPYRERRESSQVDERTLISPREYARPDPKQSTILNQDSISMTKQPSNSHLRMKTEDYANEREMLEDLNKLLTLNDYESVHNRH